MPFEPEHADWMSEDSERLTEAQSRIKHQAADTLSNPAVGFAYTDDPAGTALATDNEIVHGIMARIESNRGFFADAVVDEWVGLWEYGEPSGWTSIGEMLTATFVDEVAGAYSFDLGAPPRSDGEVVARYAVLHAEPSCGAHYSFNLRSGRQVIITDIDGTLTTSDDELIQQVSDADHDPAEYVGAGDVMRAWSAKGYRIVYVTARPHVFRSETRAWLTAHDYPVGPLLTATDLVSGDSARAYKSAWLKRIVTELEWNVVAAYGNSMSDVDAYEEAGIPKSVTFTIGEAAGEADTMPIAADGYPSHVHDYVEQQADADPL